MPIELMTQDDAVVALLAYAFSGAIGPAEGKGVIYALISTTPTTFAWSVGLEDIDADPIPIDRYLVKIDRQSKEILPPEPIMLTETELAEAIFTATGQHLASSSRFTDGMMSVSYKEATGMGRKITRLMPGDMASTVYPRLSHEERLILVQRLALAFQACWQIQLPQNHLIGELLGDETNGPTIGPDRHYNLGGPFTTVRGYLRAYIRSSFSALAKQQGIDEYKGQFLGRIGEFIDRHEHVIPAVVEDVPIVAMHADMGLHNIILSSQIPTEIQAIIDWESVASAPYASLYRIIETLFRKSAPRSRVRSRE